MGDKNRGKLFANYIYKNYPNVKKILCIADGNFITANELIKYYNNTEITVYDPKIRAKKKSKNIHAFKRCFYSTEKYKTDLIIGMHPDEATGEILEYAIKRKKSFILCPCCIKGKYANENLNKKGWINKLKGIAENNRFDVFIDYFKMKGDNIILRGNPII
jgi:hypothetical protein